MKKTPQYHARKHRAYAERKSAKRARAKAAQHTQPTPRSQRIPASRQPSIVDLFAGRALVNRFEAALIRGAKAA